MVVVVVVLVVSFFDYRAIIDKFLFVIHAIVLIKACDSMLHNEGNNTQINTRSNGTRLEKAYLYLFIHT